jgi:hypothetical protein
MFLRLSTLFLRNNVLCLSTGNRRNQFGKEMALFSQRQFSLGAPDCPVRQAGSGELGALGFRRRRTAINHWTDRWCTGLSSEPTVGRANGRPRNPRATCGRANGQKGAPDSVRCANVSKLPTVGCAKTGKKSTLDNVRWCTGLSGAPVDRRLELPS